MAWTDTIIHRSGIKLTINTGLFTEGFRSHLDRMFSYKLRFDTTIKRYHPCDIFYVPSIFRVHEALFWELITPSVQFKRLIVYHWNVNDNSRNIKREIPRYGLVTQRRAGVCVRLQSRGLETDKSKLINQWYKYQADCKKCKYFHISYVVFTTLKCLMQYASVSRHLDTLDCFAQKQTPAYETEIVVIAFFSSAKIVTFEGKWFRSRDYF